MGWAAIALGVLFVGIGYNILAFPVTALAMGRKGAVWRRILSAFSVSTLLVTAAVWVASSLLGDGADETSAFLFTFIAAIGLNAAVIRWLIPAPPKLQRS